MNFTFASMVCYFRFSHSQTLVEPGSMILKYLLFYYFFNLKTHSASLFIKVSSVLCNSVIFTPTAKIKTANHPIHRIRHCRSYCTVYVAVKVLLCFFILPLTPETPFCSGCFSDARRKISKILHFESWFFSLPCSLPSTSSPCFQRNCFFLHVGEKKKVLKSLMSEKDVTSLKKLP